MTEITKFITPGNYRRMTHQQAEELIVELAEKPVKTIKQEKRHCLTNIIKKNDWYTVVYEFNVRRGGRAAKNWNYLNGFVSYDKACKFADELAFGDTRKKTATKGGKILRVELYNENCEIMLNSSKYRDLNTE